MKRLYPTVVLTGMLAMALGLSACSSMRSDAGTGASGSTGAGSTTGVSDTNTGSAGVAGHASDTTQPPPHSGSASVGTASDAAAADMTGAQTGATGATGAAGATGTGASDAQDMTGQRTAPPPTASVTPNGTVISIEPMPSNAGSSGSSGSSSAGATGSTAGPEQAYRITLRMDDGSTQVVTQATTPSYRSGDRVNLSGGIISR